MKEQPLNRFIELKEDIDWIISRILNESNDHFGVDPDQCSWADVANLSRIAMLIGHASDILFSEGEYE